MRNSVEESESIPKPLLWSFWMLAAAIAFKLFILFTADYDIWFHLFLGQEAYVNGKIGRIDFYSFTAFGLPVINHEWLADIIITGFYNLLGGAGLILWRQIMVLAIVICCFKLIKGGTEKNLSKLFTFLCFVIVIAPGISFRVHLFSYLFLLILLNLIYSKRLNALSLLIILTLLFVIWANLHGAFILGLLIWYIHLIEKLFDKSYRLNLLSILLIIVPVFATLITPYGIKLWEFIYGELSNPISSQYITEWRRFSFEAREFPFFIVCLITWLAYLFSAKPKRFAETIILILASIMGFIAVRHTPLFVILTLPSIQSHFDGIIQKLNNILPPGKPLSPMATNLTICFVYMAMGFFLYSGISQPWKIRTDNDPLPFQSVHILKKKAIRGNLWTPLHWGAYALFHLYPNIKVSIDGRWAMLYPHNVMQDNMDFAYNGTNGRWKKLLEKYGADFALVEAGNPAIQEMNQDKNWVWGFREETCQLLVKKELAFQF